MIGKGGKGTGKWAEAISKTVKEKQRIRKDLEERGYKFQSACDGTLAYRVTFPNGKEVLADYQNPLHKIWEDEFEGKKQGK